MDTTPSDSGRIGLPPQEQLERYAIWDSYFLPSDAGADDRALAADVRRALPALRQAAVRRACVFLHAGLGTGSDAVDRRAREDPESVVAPLRRWPKLLLGMIQLNAQRVKESLAAIDRWLGDGPMLGVYFPGGNRGALACDHPNFDPLVRRIAAHQGLIMQHTWFKTGGKQYPGESTPSDLAELARRHPEVPFVCAHAGGEWEQGIRAVRSQSNISIETSGFDPTAGFIEMAIRELGAERIVFGSHLPSRSLGTELGKVLGAEIGEPQRRLILGENLRRLLKPGMARADAWAGG